MPDEVKFPNCTEELCELNKTAIAELELKFTAQDDLSEINGSVHAFFKGLWVPLDIGDQRNVCKHLREGKCPLKKGEKATFKGSLKIPSFARPNVRTFVRIRSHDEKYRTITCVMIAVRIVK